NGIARVTRKLEQSVFDLSIALGDLLGASVAERLKILHVGLDGFREIGERERKQIGVSEPKYRNSTDLCERATVHERRITEVHEPVNRRRSSGRSRRCP